MDLIEQNKLARISGNRTRILRNADRNRFYKTLLVASIYSIFMLMVPWEELQGVPFVDRNEYLTYFLYEKNILEYQSIVSLIDCLKYEILWHYLVDVLIHEIKIPIDYVFLSISFLCIFSASLFLVRRQGYYSVVLLTNPLLVALAFSQLRIAFAFSVLLLAYMSNKKVLVLVAVLFCAFIHTATFLFTGIFISIYFIKKILVGRGGRKSSIFFACLFVGLCGSLAIGPALENILGYIGDRRADVYIGDVSSGIKYTLFWTGLLFFSGFQQSSFYKNVINEYTIIILSIATFNMVTGGYTSRIIAVSLPMIITTMMNYTPAMKYSSLSLYVIYVSLQWIYWMHIRVIS